MPGLIDLQFRDGIAVATLNRPEKLNAINDDMLSDLLAFIARIGPDDAVGAAVLTGTGRAFSTGADIAGLDSKDVDGFAHTIERFMEVARAFRDCPKPVIAAINGYALAGGFELTLLCDIRFASDDAVFGLPDTPLGLSPTSGMTWLLPRIVGLGTAMHLTLSAERIDAAEAQRIGLVNRVLPRAELLAETERYAAAIASHPHIAVARTKAGFHDSLQIDFEAATRRETVDEVDCFRTPEVRERLRGFVNRRR